MLLLQLRDFFVLDSCTRVVQPLILTFHFNLVFFTLEFITLPLLLLLVVHDHKMLNYISHSFMCLYVVIPVWESESLDKYTFY